MKPYPDLIAEARAEMQQRFPAPVPFRLAIKSKSFEQRPDCYMARVLKLVDESDRVWTTAEIVSALDVRTMAAQSAISELLHRRKIVRASRGRYTRIAA